MNLTENALKNPAAVMVVVALIALFGISSLIDIPVQLFPDIERPAMSIQTGWRAASPREIESEILEPQEEVLQGLPGVERMDGNANAGQANINLSFAIGTDMRSMLVEVIGRLNRVPPLPPDATPPVVSLGGGGGGAGANETLSWFFVQLLPGTAGPVEDYRRFVEETVKPRIESVPGVAAVRINGGPPEELQITVDPYKAADLGVMLPQIANVAGRANDVSGGFVDVGRRQYTLRFEGRYAPEELRNLILAWRDGKPVRLGDVAEVKVQRPDRNFVVVQNGNPALGIEILRESGANVLSTLSGVKAVVEEMRTGVLAERGLTIAQSFDASLFINRAISLLGSNLILGILLAVGILWWFLRNLRATLLIAVAIPVSLLSTFVVLKLTGHTLNVISLAGLAFAVGMVLDAAIVVAENILRLREGGKTPFEAAFEGTRQVKGALLASTATTVAIFLPVLFIEDVEGQLFADLALTIAIAVAISMLVAITVLPAAARGWLRAQKLSDNHAPSWRRLSGWIMAATSNQRRRVAWIVGLIALPAALTVTLMPQLDYLPPVKRAAIDAFFNFPEGTSVATVEREILPVLIERLRPYMEGEKQPQLKNYYIWLWPGGGTLGARVEDESRIGELERIVRDEIVSGFPDTRAFAFEGNLFGGFGGSSRAVLVHLQSSDMDALYAAAREGERLLREKMPGANVQVWPNPDQASPELRLRPNDQRIVEVGWSRSELGSVIRTLGEGQWLGEHFDGNERIPIILRAQDWSNPEDLEALPLLTPSGAVVQLGQLADVERTTGPSNLRRVDRRRTATLVADPPPDMSLEDALTVMREQVVPPVRAMLPSDASILYDGSADSLAGAVSTMVKNFGLALLILFLLMSALFRSPGDAMLVMLALPLATVGGVLALEVLNLVTFQPLDLLTMIGFIILLGLVVNNAILIVEQARVAEREGLSRDAAVERALHQRLRPIFSSTLTSLVGMLPLVLNPGAGSVIYRGLGTVIFGGMAVSLVFTLILLPALLRMQWRKPAAELATPPVGQPQLKSVA